MRQLKQYTDNKIGQTKGIWTQNNGTQIPKLREFEKIRKPKNKNPFEESNQIVIKAECRSLPQGNTQFFLFFFFLFFWDLNSKMEICYIMEVNGFYWEKAIWRGLQVGEAIFWGDREVRWLSLSLGLWPRKLAEKSPNLKSPRYLYLLMLNANATIL